MKKLIISLALIFVVIIAVRTFLLDGGDSFLSSKELPYAIMLCEDNLNREAITLEELLGVPFPDTATDVDLTYYSEDSSGVNKEKNTKLTHWIIAKLPIEDFYNFVEQLNLTNRPDLLEFWPEAFDWYDSHPEHRFVKLWDVTKTVDDKTFYGRSSQEETYVVAKYENDKLYIKKVMMYVVIIDENGQAHLKIKER